MKIKDALIEYQDTGKDKHGLFKKKTKENSHKYNVKLYSCHLCKDFPLNKIRTDCNHI